MSDVTQLQVAELRIEPRSTLFYLNFNNYLFFTLALRLNIGSDWAHTQRGWWWAKSEGGTAFRSVNWLVDLISV